MIFLSLISKKCQNFGIENAFFVTLGEFLVLNVYFSPQIGSLFTKHDSPQAGAGPAVGSIIVLALVEHVILWSKVKDPKRRLVLLIGCFFVLFSIGTLPHVNNFSLIAGSLYGFVFALLFWSSILFQRRKILFQILFVFVIISVFLFSLVLFYGVQHVHVSSFFRDINCIPYAEGLCDEK